MYPESTNNPAAKKSLKKWFILGLGLLLIVVMVIILRPKENFEQHRLIRTHLKQDTNFARLIGSDVYAYNGLAFYKINPKTGAVEVLNSGKKLPTPGAVFWAESKGVLINFKQSFALSEVEKLLQARGLTLNEATKSYTWYIDFASGSINLVADYPVAPGLAYYSAADKGFYFIPNDDVRLSQIEHEEINTGGTSLNFYSLETRQIKTISDDLGVVDISYLGACAEQGQKICFLGRDRDDTAKEKFYAVNQDNQKVPAAESSGRLFATSDPSLLISTEGSGDSEDVSDSSIEEQVTYEETPAMLKNLKEKSLKKMGFDIGDSDIIAHFETEGEFYLIDNSLLSVTADNKTVSYRAGKIKQGGKISSKLLPLVYGNNEPFSGGIINIASYGNGGETLLTTQDNSQLLLTNRDRANDFPKIEQRKAQEIVTQCAKNSAQDNQYFGDDELFKIFFTDNQALSGNIKTFGDCLVKANPAALVGYNFYFGGLDSFNGRVTSD